MEQGRIEKNRIVVPFLMGTVVGAVFGVLFAPRRGEDTRLQLTDWLAEKRRQVVGYKAGGERIKEVLEGRKPYHDSDKRVAA